MLRLLIVGGLLVAFASQVRAENVKLPPADSDEGLLTRLFLAESWNPGHETYNLDQARQGVRAMKATVANRLKDPADFMAPKAKTYLDIVAAPGQFHGFGKDAAGKLTITPDVQNRINAVLKFANTGKPGKYAAFVEMCIEVAKAPVDDPFKDVKKVGTVDTVGGTYGWRPVTSPGLGANFVAIPAAQGGVILGNQFYTIKK